MSEAETFFIAESIRHARTLPLCENIMFLEGLAASIGRDHPLHSHLMATRELLNNGSATLDLIAAGQIELPRE